MDLDNTEPEPARGSGPDIVQEIQDSFQAVLDALDAARADLYAFDDEQNGAEIPPPSWAPYREPVTDAGGAARQVHVQQDVVVEPLWLRGSQPETVPPPPTELPSGAPGADPTQAAPPMTFPPPAPQHRPARRGAGPHPDTPRSATPQRVPPSDQPVAPASGALQPPVRVPATKGRRGRRFTDRRKTRVAGVFGVGAVSGLILASSLLANDSPIPETSSPPAGRPDQSLPDNPAPSLPEIPGTGLLREGDSGHGVYELQVRLLQVPNIYDGGPIDGRYDKEVRMAVARFQKWYGIRDDETGVYGDHTRHALMLRTR